MNSETGDAERILHCRCPTEFCVTVRTRKC